MSCTPGDQIITLNLKLLSDNSIIFSLMVINFPFVKIASYPSRTVLFENFFCVGAVLYLVYNLES